MDVQPAAASRAYDLVLTHVATQRELLDVWHPLHVRIFPDKDDQTPKSTLREEFRKEQNSFFLLKNAAGGKPVGLAWREFDPDISEGMYAAYGGLIPAYRNQGVYRHMLRESDAEMQRIGAAYCLFEVEDPSRIAGSYPDENPRRVMRRAENRINFWRRTGAIIVRDPDIQYLRPASSDPEKIQPTEMMAIRPFDDRDPRWAKMLNPSRSAIRKSAARELYMEIMRLEYDNLPERAMRKELPAVHQFLTSVDASPKQWLTLQSGLIAPKLTPDAIVAIRTEPAIRGRHAVARPQI